jgi:hypothetical protein
MASVFVKWNDQSASFIELVEVGRRLDGVTFLRVLNSPRGSPDVYYITRVRDSFDKICYQLLLHPLALDLTEFGITREL